LTIQKSGEKAAAIVWDLLPLTRRGVLSLEVLNLNRIVTEYLESPQCERLRFYHPRVEIETNLEANLPNILGSPVHLCKTVMNLVSNAAEAMPEGGRTLVSTAIWYVAKRIRSYENIREGDYVTLSVSDTGEGISSEDMKRIFEPFYSKKVMGRSGTGLGMAVVWGAVKDHKGYIDLQSVRGKGTTFTLYFPITKRKAKTDVWSLSPRDYEGKGESILVVDDIEEQREIASMMLNELGYCATSVSSGREAVEYVRNNPVDLVILDMIMDPGIDGLETYRRILQLYPQQKAILVSGFSETERVKEAQQLGAGAYVRKPYVLEKIGVAIRAELDKSKSSGTVSLS
jgi:CheY-like chemotaxis protein